MAFSTSSLVGICLLGLQMLSNAFPSPQPPMATFTKIVPSPAPTIPPYTVMSYRSGAEIHLMPWKARNFAVFLGGDTAAYCPYPPDYCPHGNETIFRQQGSLDTIVPGGQITYIAPDGHLGYTQAHMNEYPAGSILLPLILGMDSLLEPARFLTTGAFGANGFMGCPLDGSPGEYQVFAAINNATAPTRNITDCPIFTALAFNYEGPPVYQYE